MTDDESAPPPEVAPEKPANSEQDAVGYGKPPKHTQWKKGQSGNSRGRPKGQANFKTDLSEVLGRKIRVTEGGKPVGMTNQRAFVTALVMRAIKGDARASASLLTAVIKLLGDQEAPEPTVLPEKDQAILEAFLARNSRKGDEQ